MDRARSISKSMMSYLKRAREHKEFLLRETKEFERGKRHLANMMGIDAKEMTQQDIDDAIKYLFPSGLFEPRARPIMKHPDFLYKAQKEAQFDVTGRPNHYLFYTVKPNFHECLSTLSAKIRELNSYEDEQLARGVITAPADQHYHFSGRVWLKHEEVCDHFIEPILEGEYEYFVKCLEELLRHPYSIRVKDFIDKYSVEQAGQSTNLVLPDLITDHETGQIYTDQLTISRMTRLQIKTVLNGSGIIDIEGRDILYFKNPHIRNMFMSPLRLTNMIDKVDLHAKLVMIPQTFGESAVAKCCRYAISTSLAAYLGPEARENLRIAGLLTLDARPRERKKFGQAGARKKYTWKKR